MDMDDDLLAAARWKREALRKLAKDARLAADEAEDEARRADESVAMLERVQRDQIDDFNAAASGILGGN
jgi:hypothetical protein